MKLNKRNKRKKTKKRKNENINNLKSNQTEHSEEETSLIKNKNNNNNKYINITKNYNIKLSKICFIFFVIIFINIIYRNKANLPIPKEILKLRNKSLQWHQKVKKFLIYAPKD